MQLPPFRGLPSIERDILFDGLSIDASGKRRGMPLLSAFRPRQLVPKSSELVAVALRAAYREGVPGHRLSAHPSYSPSSSSNSPSSSAVASWYSETKSFIFDSASVNSISSMPSPH